MGPPILVAGRFIAITPDGTKAYVVNGAAGEVSVIDLSSRTVVATISALSTRLGPVAITPDGTTAYVIEYDNGFYTIDVATNAATGPGGPGEPEDLAITPDGSTLYVTDNAMIFGGVLVFDLAPISLVRIVEVGIFANDVAITPFTARQQIEHLKTCVQDLLSQGDISLKQAEELIKTLDQALASLVGGRSQAVKGRLENFIRREERRGRISSDDATVLIALAGRPRINRGQLVT